MSFSRSTPPLPPAAARHAVEHASRTLVEEHFAALSDPENSTTDRQARLATVAAAQYKTIANQTIDDTPEGLEVVTSLSGHFDAQGVGGYTIQVGYRLPVPEKVPA